MSIPSEGTDRPIIGIVAQGIKNTNILKYFSEARGKSFIPASYVKFIESAGGRVVPITDQSSESELDYLFSSINGVLLPGGAADLSSSSYARTGKFLFEKAIQANDNDVYFPVMGICLGFQLLVSHTADTDVKSQIPSEGLQLLQFTEAWQSSKLSKGPTSELIKTLSTQTRAYYHNKFAFKPNVFDEILTLKNFYNIVAIGKNNDNESFVSAIEAKSYPFYGFQWHPEKAQFEWSQKLELDHSLETIQAMQSIANFFVNEARRNSHKFQSKRKENESLIWNHQPLYTGDISEYEQIYIF